MRATRRSDSVYVVCISIGIYLCCCCVLYCSPKEEVRARFPDCCLPAWLVGRVVKKARFFLRFLRRLSLYVVLMSQSMMRAVHEWLECQCWGGKRRGEEEENPTTLLLFLSLVFFWNKLAVTQVPAVTTTDRSVLYNEDLTIVGSDLVLFRFFYLAINSLCIFSILSLSLAFWSRRMSGLTMYNSLDGGSKAINGAA